MNENKIQWVIEGDGRMFREETHRSEVEPGDAFQRALTSDITVRLRNFIELPEYGFCHVVADSHGPSQWWSIPMPTLNFRTTFATKDGIMYPTFLPAGQTETPVLEIPWSIFDAFDGQAEPMYLRFVVQLKPVGAQWCANDHYLYALDRRKGCWRLPIANLYDTCQVCMGEYISTAPSAYDSVQKALAQFRRASWNSDLFYNRDTISDFVRFKPLEKGFETLPIRGAWANSCAKVSTTNVNYAEI